MSIPAQLASPLVSCPNCATVLDVSAALAPAAAPAPMPQSSAATATVQSPRQMVTNSGSPVASRRMTRRRKQSNGWILVVLLVAAAAGLGYAVIKYNQSQTDLAEQNANNAKPSTAAFNSACQYVRGHLQQTQPNAAKQAAFGPYKARLRPSDGAYVIEGVVDVPISGGKMVAQTFDVEVRPDAGGAWKLVSLTYDRDLIFAEERMASNVPDFKYTNTNKEPDDWVFNTGGGNRGPGKDYFDGQHIAWGVDAVLAQIKESAGLHKTLVVWLFDKSASAAGYRNEAAATLAEKYRDLNGTIDKSGEMPLLTVVGAFGKEVEFLIEEPTDDDKAIEVAINSIEQEDSGQENVFGAILAAAEKFKDMRKDQGRQVMIVVVSDEAGDDEREIENVLAITKKHTIPVSVVGGRAPFGRRAIPGVNLEAPNDLGNNSRAASLMHQGPESLLPEVISLGFFNPNYGGDESESIDSGFGPYSLTRLTIESGGVYYACRADMGGGMRSGRGAANWNPSAGLMYTFDPKVMAKYKPQYISEKEFQQQLSENKCRKAVIDAAKVPKVETMKFVRTDFPRARDEAQSKRELDEAQKGAATVEPRVAALYDALKPGEADRNSKETSPRWQAAFDLSYGRVLAAKARTEGYNAMLARMKGGFPYTNEQSSMFKLVSADTLDAGSALEKLVKDSKKYLQRVIDQHPDTPWAFLAQRELETPCGWKWVEDLPAGAMPAEAAESEDE
ncbi:MAG: vWA domain-containing protein [Pirellulales bacterium]